MPLQLPLTSINCANECCNSDWKKSTTAAPPSVSLPRGTCLGGVLSNGPNQSPGLSIGQHAKALYAFKKPGGRTAQQQISCRTTQVSTSRIRQLLSLTMEDCLAEWPFSFRVVFALSVKKLSSLAKSLQRMSKVDQTATGSSPHTATQPLLVQTVKYWPPGSATIKMNLPHSSCSEILIAAISLHHKYGNSSSTQPMGKTS